MKNLVSALLILLWNCAETKNTFGFRIFSVRKSRVSTSFRNLESLGVQISTRIPLTETCWNLQLASPNSFSMQNHFGKLAYVKFSQLKFAETGPCIIEILQINLVHMASKHPNTKYISVLVRVTTISSYWIIAI